jgi:hypothetical protein
MARIVEVVAFERVTDEGASAADVKVDLGGGEIRSAQHFGDSGDDSQPLPGDYATAEQTQGQGRVAISGYTDPHNAGQAGGGEKRIYSRNPQGVPVAHIWAKGDGSIVIEVLAAGGSAPITIKSAGPVIVDSPDVTLGGTGGRKVACLGDIVAGSINALTTAPGSPIAPVPPMTPTPTGGIPFVAKIISSSANVKAR